MSPRIFQPFFQLLLFYWLSLTYSNLPPGVDSKNLTSFFPHKWHFFFAGFCHPTSSLFPSFIHILLETYLLPNFIYLNSKTWLLFLSLHFSSFLFLFLPLLLLPLSFTYYAQNFFPSFTSFSSSTLPYSFHLATVSVASEDMQALACDWGRENVRNVLNDSRQISWCQREATTNLYPSTKKPKQNKVNPSKQSFSEFSIFSEVQAWLYFSLKDLLQQWPFKYYSASETLSQNQYESTHELLNWEENSQISSHLLSFEWSSTCSYEDEFIEWIMVFLIPALF